MADLDAFIRSYGYPAIFAGVMGEQFAPIPGEPLLLAAGALAGTGHLTLGLAATVALLGAVVSDVVWYEIGRGGGHRVLRWLCRLSIEPDSCVRRSEEMLGRRGPARRQVRSGSAQCGATAGGCARDATRSVPPVRPAGRPALGGTLRRTRLRVSAQLVQAVSLAEHLRGGAFLVLAGAFAVYLAVKVVRRQRFLRQLWIARITPDELKTKLDRGESVFVVDLRHRVDVQAEPTGIPGAVHMEPSELEQAAARIPRDRDVVVYCT